MKIDDEVKVISRHLCLWKWFNVIGKIVEIDNNSDTYKVQFQDLPDCFLNRCEIELTTTTKLYAKVIVPRTELPPLAAIYSGKIGEVIDAPDGRDASNVVWLKFANGKIGWFGYEEIELLEVSLEDAPPEYLQVPIGEVKGDIVWIEVENPERNCEVKYYDG